MARPKMFNGDSHILTALENALWELQYRKNEISNNKSHTDSYEREATADFDEMILDYEERLILLEVGE